MKLIIAIYFCLYFSTNVQGQDLYTNLKLNSTYTSEVRELKKGLIRYDRYYVDNDNLTNPGLDVCMITIEGDVMNYEFSSLLKTYLCDSLFTFTAKPNTLLITSGGFYSTDYDHDGLFIENGIKLSNTSLWQEGGALIVTNNKTLLEIIRYSTIDKLIPNSIDYAIQSKPILIYSGINDMDSTSQSVVTANRLLIGNTFKGKTVVISFVDNENSAVSLLESATLLSKVSIGNDGDSIKNLIAVDGGPAVYVYSPLLNLRINSLNSERNFRADIIHIKSMQDE